MNSPRKSTYREIYESQNDCSISGVTIKINCENHLDSSTKSNNLSTTANEFNPIPSSSSAQSSNSFLDNVDNFENSTTLSNPKSSFHKPQLINNQLNALDDDIIIELPEVEYPAQEPLVIRGDSRGSITLFGLSNMFCSDFPSILIGRIAKEEFQATIQKINTLLRDHHNISLKLMLLGCLCCCCSLGCSLLWPTLALSKRTRTSLEKLLAEENNRLYNKLGFNWKLSKETCHSNSTFVEYVILIEFTQKLQIYQPD